MAMALALVPTTSKPWITSSLVMRNVTGLLAGISMGSGVKEYIEATTLATTVPSGCVLTAGGANSGYWPSARGSTVSMWLGGCTAANPALSSTAPAKITSTPTASHIQILS